MLPTKRFPVHLLFYICFFVIMVSSCESLKESSKYQFVEGYYKTTIQGKKQTLYVLTGSDTIKAFRKTDLNKAVIDTSHAFIFAFPARRPNDFRGLSFSRKTFDFDVLTILFKYRPPVSGFPPQFNATFNGAVYLGYRTDAYKLSYQSTPLHLMKRSITHYGYSFGFFTGLGSARIDEFVSNGALNYEYDGLVNLSGFAAIIALDKLTMGITLGVDHLLDRNSKVWVNNGKPWLGLSLGLNLN
jgi:hypothetical protein